MAQSLQQGPHLGYSKAFIGRARDLEYPIGPFAGMFGKTPVGAHSYASAKQPWANILVPINGVANKRFSPGRIGLPDFNYG